MLIAGANRMAAAGVQTRKSKSTSRGSEDTQEQYRASRLVSGILKQQSTNMVITRKIQLLFDLPKDAPKAALKECYDKIYGWQRICHRAANWIASHHYMMENLKQFHYLTEGEKVKIANIEKDEHGILTMSTANTTYQVLSKAFKGECPMGMLSGLNQVVMKSFKEEKSDVMYGKKSLRTYRNTVPMPVRSADISNWMKLEDGNWSFYVYGTAFKTNFGRDLSGNENIMDGSKDGQYKLCDSSIQIKDNKIFLLAVFEFEKQEFKPDPDKEIIACLDINIPIVIKDGKKVFNIGSAEEFLYRRLSIQRAHRSAQISSRHNAGGDGRKLKMQATERFAEMEKNYVTSRIHSYTRKLVDYAIKVKAARIVLEDQEEKEKEAKGDPEFLLRNWGYFGMKEKAKYKAAKYGIEVKYGQKVL